MIYIEEAVKKFNMMPFVLRHEAENKWVLAAIKELEGQYDVDISAILIFFFVNELKQDDIESYLIKEYSLEKAKAKTISQQIQQKIINPLVLRLNFLNIDQTRPLTIEQEKKYAVDYFTQNLANEFNSDPLIIDIINRKIFILLNHDVKYKDEFAKAILNNNEEIFSNRQIMDEKKTKSIVSVWIKDFINFYGTKIFDAVDLSAYFAASANAKKLTEEERSLLIKILNTYRNIKFFPESMPTDDGEDWEILPIDKGDRVLSKAKTITGPPMTQDEKKIAELKREGEKLADKDIEKLALKEEIEAKKKIEDLKILANRFKEGSLQRRAIEEEIKKLSI